MLTQVGTSPAHHERQLELRRRVQRVGLRGRRERDRALGTPEAALGVGHDRQVLRGPVEPTHGPQFTQRLRVAPGGVRGDAGGLAHDVDAPAATHGSLGVLVRELGVDVQETARHDEVLADALSVLLAQAAEPLTRILGELTEVHVLGDLRLLDPRLGRPLRPCRT